MSCKQTVLPQRCDVMAARESTWDQNIAVWSEVEGVRFCTRCIIMIKSIDQRNPRYKFSISIWGLLSWRAGGTVAMDKTFKPWSSWTMFKLDFSNTLLCIKHKIGSPLKKKEEKKKEIEKKVQAHFFFTPQSLRTADETQHTLLRAH